MNSHPTADHTRKSISWIVAKAKNPTPSQHPHIKNNSVGIDDSEQRGGENLDQMNGVMVGNSHVHDILLQHT